MATAITCANNDDLKEDWIEPLDQTLTPEQLLLDALGFPSLLPPPAQVRTVEAAIGASRAEPSPAEMPRRRKFGGRAGRPAARVRRTSPLAPFVLNFWNGASAC